jgi:hypothetical protein
MKRFIQHHAEQISGTLSDFDRLRFRGTLRWLAYTDGMQWFLNSSGILLKEFKTYVQGVTDQVRAATEQLVKAAGRKLIYLNSSRISKEEKAREIAERDGRRTVLHGRRLRPPKTPSPRSLQQPPLKPSQLPHSREILFSPSPHSWCD